MSEHDREPEVSLKSGVELEGPLTVGYIQTMTQADRVAVYTSDGTPSGQKLVEEHVSVLMGKTQDAAGHFKEDKNHTWSKGPTVARCSSAMPARPGSPRRESFQIALAIKDGNAASIKLATTNWGVGWTTTVDPNLHTGTGNKGPVVPAIGTFAGVGDGTGLTHTDAVSWRAPQSDEEAMAMSSRELLTALPAARQNDADAYGRIARALRSKTRPSASPSIATRTTPTRRRRHRDQRRGHARGEVAQWDHQYRQGLRHQLRAVGALRSV